MHRFPCRLTRPSRLVELNTSRYSFSTYRKSTSPQSELGILMTGISIWQILIVLVVVLLLFGNRLPSIARSLGKSLVEFKKGVKEIEDHSEDHDEETPGG